MYCSAGLLLLLLLLAVLSDVGRAAVAAAPDFAAGGLTLELVTFRTTAGVNPAQLVAAARWMTPWFQAQPGFKDRALSVKADGSWIDTVHWATWADAIAAARRIVSAPACRPFLSLLDNRTVHLRHALIEYELGGPRGGNGGGGGGTPANVTVWANGTLTWSGLTLEFSPFTLKNATTWASAADLAKGMAPFLQARSGFISRATSVTNTEVWHDVLHWETRADAMSAAAAAASSSAAARFFAVMNTSSIHHAAIVLLIPPTGSAAPADDGGLFKGPVEIVLVLLLAAVVGAAIGVFLRFREHPRGSSGGASDESARLNPRPSSSYGVA